MAANVPDPMDREREQPRITSAPKIDRHFLIYDFKAKPCTLDDCEGPGKCLFKHDGERGRRDPSIFQYRPYPCFNYCRNGGSCPQGDTCQSAHGLLEFCFHPQKLSIMSALKFRSEAYSWLADVFPCERAAVQLILDLESTGQICEEYEDDVILLNPFYNGTGNGMAISRAAIDSMSKLGHDDLPKTTLGSIIEPKFPRIISGSCKFMPWDFAVPPTVVICKDFHKFPHGHYLPKTSTGGSSDGPKFLATNRSCKLVSEELAGTSTVGNRMPLVCVVDAWRMFGGGSAQTNPDHGTLVEPGDLKLDSGASNHVVGEKILLQGYESLVQPWYIHVADGYPLEVVGIGYIITKEFFIPNVYRVKGLKGNLISVSQLGADHGLFCGFDGSKCEVLKRDGEVVGGGIVQANGIYKLRFLEVPEAEAEAGYENA